MNIKKSILLRVRVVFLLVVLFAVTIAARIVDLQYIEGEKWAALGEEISLEMMEIEATRGNIYSDNGSLLATSVPYYRVALDPQVLDQKIFFEEVDSLAYFLSREFGGKSQAQYKQQIVKARETGRQYIILSKQLVNYQVKKRMENWPVFRYGRHGGGVIFEKVNKRVKPFNYMGFRTIGFINENNYGAGLEYSFNKDLAGQNGQALYQKIAGGYWKPVYDGNEVKTINGYDLYTTLDVNLQDVAESALLRALKSHDADYGSVVLMEVETGQIKAMSNLSKGSDTQYFERYNYSVGDQGLREPGSTFKLVSAIALLEEGKVSLDDTIDTGDGKYEFYDRIMRDATEGGYGKITFREAIEKSSNVAISRWVYEAYKDRPEAFIKIIRDIGLDQPLGFHMAGEGVPYIKTPDDPSWSGISLPWMSIGYELKLTPLQTLALYNAIANDGKLIRPIIVNEVRSGDRVIRRYEPEVLNRKICSDETIEKIRTTLEGVVERGTANNIRGTAYTIAGKTGTAQKLVNGRYSRNAYYTSFVGYFPADEPKYSCIVVIDNPRGVFQYGNSVAAPVFKEIADKIYAQDMALHEAVSNDFEYPKGIFPVIRSGYHPDLSLICNRLGISNHLAEEGPEWVDAEIYNNSIRWNPNQDGTQQVPDVSGMTLRDAIFLLENKGLQVDFEGAGRVVRQSLLPGTTVHKGSNIKLMLD